MKGLLPDALALLRRARHGVLASHSAAVSGFPYASLLPFVLDEAARPLFVISRLAEHTQNMQADQRVSLLVHEGGADLGKARLTILGRVAPVAADESIIARIARYNADLAGYLELGDFAIWRLQPETARYIAGFGRMGWIEEAEWQGLPILPLADEAALLARYGNKLAGIDLAGIDLKGQYGPERIDFELPCTDTAALPAAIEKILGERAG